MKEIKLADNEMTFAKSYDLQLFNDEEFVEESTEEVVESETTEDTNTETETEEVANSEVEESEEGTEKVNEDVTQTQAFSRRLNEEREKIRQEAETQAVDRYIAKQYEGQEWNGKPILCKADLDQALYEQRLINAGQDPEIVKHLVDEHPDVKAARESSYNINQWKELTSEHPELKDATQLSPEVISMYSKGVPLLDAYNRVYVKEQKAREAKVKLETEQETLRKINNNAISSPGSASSGGVIHKTKSVEDMSAEEFEAYREEVRKQRRDD